MRALMMIKISVITYPLSYGALSTKYEERKTKTTYFKSLEKKKIVQRKYGCG